jgi:hypothetical protein
MFMNAAVYLALILEHWYTPCQWLLHAPAADAALADAAVAVADDPIVAIST